ncbi:hydratase, partial [Ilyobacter sp.]|uniref:hydratase n=1 Tax=Ilyobacter sp. TaxID=3100343 RepID=UPI003563E0D3
MIKVYEKGQFIKDGQIIADMNTSIEDAKKNTITYGILKNHNYSDDMENLKIKFDAITSPDNNSVSIIQTAKASGLKKFPVPYVLSNCHNSLCAVGGTINEDDHLFGLSAAKKYGGYFLPPHMGVLHQYMRELFAGSGKMILGSDSHTRYGALGCLAMGEGGGEVVKQLLNKTYDIKYPKVIGVKLTGKPKPGIGPMDVALAFIREVYPKEYVKNCVLEFFGEGIKNLNVEFRNGIDVMTSESNCLSSIWETDKQVREYLKTHNRGHEYMELKADGTVYYDGLVEISLDEIQSMIALPAHPSNAYTIKELYDNLDEICEKTNRDLRKIGINFDLKEKIFKGKLKAEQGIIGGCSGGIYDNIIDAADILNGKSIDLEFTLNIYPASKNTGITLMDNKTSSKLLRAGAVIRTSICGPCFGVGDTPGNNQLSIRHNTRNFPNREGAKPSQGQSAGVALMDARSIAATAINNGIITAATDLNIEYTKPQYIFDSKIYEGKVYNYGKTEGLEDSTVELLNGPCIKPWPAMSKLDDNLLLKVTAFIEDPVTTTDELMPSGEASSFRSDPDRLSEFTLITKVPDYVHKCKDIRELEYARKNGELKPEINEIFDKIKTIEGQSKLNPFKTAIGSLIYANKPGDGSAREQAASNQKVLGGWANIAKEYATKRYVSNLINWGILPFIIEEEIPFGT